MTFVAIINIPGHLGSGQDELPEFDQCYQAWQHLYDRRLSDLEDAMNDESDHVVEGDGALDEMAGFLDDPEPGTVYGTTPGYDGDHDLGLAYTVMAQRVGN